MKYRIPSVCLIGVIPTAETPLITEDNFYLITEDEILLIAE